VRILGAGAVPVRQDAFDVGHDVQKCDLPDIGRKADQSTRIITSTETALGVDSTDNTPASTASTTVWITPQGWQFDSLEDSVIGPFLLQNGVQQRVTIDWTVGLFQEHTRAVARLYDIKVKP